MRIPRAVPIFRDSATLVAHPSADITDTYAFPSPANSNNVVLVMNTYPQLPSGGTFDPNVLYQFKIHHGTTAAPVANGTAADSGLEDTVIQFSVDQGGSGQTSHDVRAVGTDADRFALDRRTDDCERVDSGSTQTGGTNLTVKAASGSTAINVFAGPRSDPDFFDLARFYSIFPDRYYTESRGRYERTLIDKDRLSRLSRRKRLRHDCRI